MPQILSLRADELGRRVDGFSFRVRRIGFS